MPPKRKLRSDVPSNAASAAAYSDSTGNRANKRSRASKPAAKIDDFLINGANGTKSHSPDDNASSPTVKNDRDSNGSPEFDHSRAEETAGIVDRRFYAAEMSNERCAMYNNDEIPRPIELLNETLESTASARKNITTGKEKGDAVVHWFKRDLRVRDNTGLSEAAKLAKDLGVGVIGLWIMSPQDWEAHLVSPAKCDFEIRSIEVMKRDLAELDIPLHIEVVEKRRNVPKRIVELAQQWNVKNLFCNLEYEPDELRREERLVQTCLDKGIRFDPVHDDCVVPPGNLKTGAGRQYAVYTPWFRQWIAHIHSHPDVLDERPTPDKNPPAFVDKFKALFDAQIPEAPDSKRLSPEDKKRLAQLWPAGEGAALDRLQHFLNEKVGQYKATRNFPSANSTACVSAHHAAGTLAARTSVRTARDVNSTKRLDGGNEGIKGWISEVAWRDFYRHVLVNWPYVW
jgi:deoxyribodipyrimidine photo-lyase